MSGACGSGTSAAFQLRELAPPPVAHRLRQPRVLMVREVLERRRIGVLLAHEQHRHRRRQNHRRRHGVLAAGPQLRQPLTDGAVADLIVVLRADDEALARQRA